MPQRMFTKRLWKENNIVYYIDVADGSILPSSVSWDSYYEAVKRINRSTIKYMEELESELSSMPGYKKPENVETEKESLKSRINSGVW